MTYKHDAVVRAWLDGKRIQRKNAFGDWIDVWESEIASAVPAFSSDESYRIKPEVVKYRRWISASNSLQRKYIGVVNSYENISFVEKLPSFLKWIDTEWQEVEV